MNKLQLSSIRVRLLAVVGLVLPSVLVVLALAMLYVQQGGLWWIQALLWGLAPGALRVSRSSFSNSGDGCSFMVCLQLLFQARK